MNFKHLCSALLCVGAMALGTASHAAPVGPTYSAPVSYSWLGTGISAGHAGGVDWDFSSVNTASFDALFWGPGNIQSALDGSIDSAGETLAFSAIGTTGTGDSYAQWTGSTSVATTSGLQSVATRFTATILTGETWVAAGTAGVTEAGYPVVIQLSDADFTVNLLFEASTDGGTTWFAQNALYDALPTTGGSGQSLTGFNSGFYYEVTPVPVPTSIPLLGSALAAFAGLRILRRRS